MVALRSTGSAPGGRWGGASNPRDGSDRRAHGVGLAMQDAENTPANLNAHIETQLAQSSGARRSTPMRSWRRNRLSSPLRSSLEPRVAPAQRLKAASPLSSPEVEPLAADPAPPVPRAAARSVPSLQDAYKACMKAREKALGHNPHTRGRNPVRTAAPLSRRAPPGCPVERQPPADHERQPTAAPSSCGSRRTSRRRRPPGSARSVQHGRAAAHRAGLSCPAEHARSRGKSMSHAEREMLEVERLKASSSSNTSATWTPGAGRGRQLRLPEGQRLLEAPHDAQVAEEHPREAPRHPPLFAGAPRRRPR